LFYLTTYIDDTLVSSNSLRTVEEVKAYLGKECEIPDLGEATQFLGNMTIRDTGKGTVKI
jgi:hypothetical protein